MSRAISISLICVLIWGTAVWAAPAGITDIAVMQNNGHLAASAVYRGGFTPEIKKEIINGVSRDFFYYLVLHRVMSNWLDEEKASKTIKYTVKYDILKNQFHVIKSGWGLREEQVFDSYDEMVKWVSAIEKVHIAPLRTLSSGHRYYISVKAEIKAGEIPFFLRYLLFFIPYSEFSTEWAHSGEFTLRDLK